MQQEKTPAQSETLSGTKEVRTPILNAKSLRELTERIKAKHDEWARAKVQEGLKKGKINLSKTGEKWVEFSISETEAFFKEALEYGETKVLQAKLESTAFFTKATQDLVAKKDEEIANAYRDGMRKVFSEWHSIRKEEIQKVVEDYGDNMLDMDAWAQIYVGIRERLFMREKELLPDEAEKVEEVGK